MGVYTTAYSVPPKTIRKIRRNPENFDLLVGDVESDAAEWKVDTHDFGRVWDETIGILGEGGFVKTRAKLQTEDYLDFSGYDVLIFPPSVVRIVAEELETADFETLKATGLAKEVTDYYGHTIPEYMYSYYIGDIEDTKKFFKKAAAAGHYILTATA